MKLFLTGLKNEVSKVETNMTLVCKNNQAFERITY